MDPELETQCAGIDQGLAEGLVCATVTLILFYVNFLNVWQVLW